jgi:hypothetical protein
MKVCFGADTYGYTDGGGHLWEYLNWALGLRAVGCDVIWVEPVPEHETDEGLALNEQALRERLAPYGLADALAFARVGQPVEEAAGADLYVNLAYGPPAEIPACRRSVLVDIDPGLLQTWAAKGWIDISGYDLYFTVGETVGTPGARFPDAGIGWRYTRSSVSLEHWPATTAPDDAPFTTVSNWDTYDEWMEDGGEWYSNDKKGGFVPYLDLPPLVGTPLELALGLGSDGHEEAEALEARGWRVVRAPEVAGTPWAYREYIVGSRGEFSCAKPSCVRMQNAWISNRTLCYLATGRPAVVEHTGPSAFLPDAEGLLRFRSPEEAAVALEEVTSDYDRHAAAARALAEEHFDARKVVGRLLEEALP